MGLVYSVKNRIIAIKKGIRLIKIGTILCPLSKTGMPINNDKIPIAINNPIETQIPADIGLISFSILTPSKTYRTYLSTLSWLLSPAYKQFENNLYLFQNLCIQQCHYHVQSPSKYLNSLYVFILFYHPKTQ